MKKIRKKNILKQIEKVLEEKNFITKKLPKNQITQVFERAIICVI